MSKTRIQFRVDRKKFATFKNIANNQNKPYSHILRCKVEDVINYEANIYDRIKAIIIDLKQPFAFVKTEKGMEKAKARREVRKELIKKLEAIIK